MFIRRKDKKIFVIVLCLLFFTLFLPKVSAKTLVDLDKKANLKIEYLKNKSVAGVEFKLFKIANIDEKLKYSFTDEFKSYGMYLCPENEENLSECASALAAYAKRDKIKATLLDKTTEDNTVAFNNIDVGMYLVTAENVNLDNRIYRHKPNIVILPNVLNERAVYNLFEHSNYTFSEMNKEEKIYRKALLVWEDKGNEESRPESIEVQVLRDGTLYSSVKISAQNNWRYSWGPLSNSHEWTIIQKDVPRDYIFTMDRKGRTFVLKNKYAPCLAKESSDLGERYFAKKGHSDKKVDKILPKAGLLWWPVPILVCLGVLLFGIGIFNNIKEV